MNEACLCREKSGHAKTLDRRYADAVYSFARLLLRDGAAEDVAVEVLHGLLNGLPTAPRNARAFRIASLRATREAALARLSAESDASARRVIGIQSRRSVPAKLPVALEHVHDTELVALIEELRLDEREALFLGYGCGLSMQETAEVIGTSIATVRDLERRALHALSQSLVAAAALRARAVC